MCCAGLNVWQSPIWRCVAPQQRVRLSNCNYQFTYSLYIRLRLLSRTYKCGRQINVRNWDIDLLLLLQSHSVVPPPSAVQSPCSPSLQSLNHQMSSQMCRTEACLLFTILSFPSRLSCLTMSVCGPRDSAWRFSQSTLTVGPPRPEHCPPRLLTGVCLTCPRGK